MDKLSVCIVIYRNYDEVLNAVISLEKLTSKEISKKLYLVDNSEEESFEKEKFKKDIKSFKDVYYFEMNKNIGFGAGHNYLIPKFNSEYHCIMNPDIVFIEDSFSILLDFLDTHSDVGMVIPNIIGENGERQSVYREDVTICDMFIRMFCSKHFKKRQFKHTLQYKNYAKPFDVPFGQGSFLVIRTNIFKRLKGFDENYFMYMEDADLCRRVRNVSRFMYVPYTTVIHKWEQASHKNLKLFNTHIKSMIRYFKKWGIKFI